MLKPLFAALLFMMALVSDGARAEITGITIEITPSGSELLTFKSSSSIAVTQSFIVDAPDRVVIDMPSTHAPGLKLPKNYRGQLLKGIRFGQFTPTTSRIVLDAQVPVKIVEVIEGSPLTVEIEALEPNTQKVEAPTGQATKNASEPMKSNIGKEVRQTTESNEAKNIEKPQKPLIVIDAGHGGQDPGALGLHGTHEKEITLNYARALRAALLKTGRYRVLLTRDADHFVMLQERVAIARKAKGDLFISFHADSNPIAKARGLSIYTLSETASDDEAAALAERENKSDIIPNLDLNTTDADVASILIDLTQRETMNKSARFADAIVKNISPKVSKLPKTHRFAGFRVLKAPDIPSVLIELGFLSNATDERLLLTPKYRDAVIRSIVKGVDRFHRAE